MLRDIHTALQRLFYQCGNISPQEVDIRFDAPTRECIEQLTRPTIYLFLVALQENIGLRQPKFEANYQHNRTERRPMPRRFDLRYMVFTLTREIEDDHLLLWRALLTLIRNPYIPSDLLSDELRRLNPPLVTRIEQRDEEPTFLNFWNACGIPPRPALSYIITIPVNSEVLTEEPLVLTHSTRPSPKWADRPLQEIKQQIGGIVHGMDSAPLMGARVALEGRANESCITDHEGRFSLRHVPTGLIRLRITLPDRGHKIVLIEVPSTSTEAQDGEVLYDIFLKSSSTREA
ncbi:Pvc16 family protein [Tengunoibacter tsumagoiensis]|uniref:Pvc16 N-terminal domain-containing protein n=1 Tax=Tengunoibacter tsumagoiensis TaxID=2014871 RepID=A0A402AAH2_9CHLR|nr:Pvc16 family protein [Tengunoibacter tsumagoiensis]GCE16164.1 hypothetical protein KTT_60230 [Tengunoibacter tsumagoiensis]